MQQVAKRHQTTFIFVLTSGLFRLIWIHIKKETKLRENIKRGNCITSKSIGPSYLQCARRCWLFSHSFIKWCMTFSLLKEIKFTNFLTSLVRLLFWGGAENRTIISTPTQRKSAPYECTFLKRRGKKDLKAQKGNLLFNNQRPGFWSVLNWHLNAH